MNQLVKIQDFEPLVEYIRYISSTMVVEFQFPPKFFKINWRELNSGVNYRLIRGQYDEFDSLTLRLQFVNKDMFNLINDLHTKYKQIQRQSSEDCLDTFRYLVNSLLKED